MGGDLNPGDLYKVTMTEHPRRTEQRCDSVTNIRPQSTALLASTPNEYMTTDSNRNKQATGASRSKSAATPNNLGAKEVITTRRNSKKAVAQKSPGSSAKKQQNASQNSAKKTSQTRYLNLLNQKKHVPSKSTASEIDQFKPNPIVSDIKLSNYNTLKNSPQKKKSEMQSFGSPVIELMVEEITNINVRADAE